MLSHPLFFSFWQTMSVIVYVSGLMINAYVNYMHDYLIAQTDSVIQQILNEQYKMYWPNTPPIGQAVT